MPKRVFKMRTKKRTIIKRVPRTLRTKKIVNSSVHTFSLRHQYPSLNFAVGSSGYLGVGYDFSLQQIANYTEYVALFDQYRINSVSITFCNRFNTCSQNESGVIQIGMPYGLFNIDTDDSTAPTSSEIGMAAMRECRRTKQVNFTVGRAYSIKVTPRVASTVYRTITSSAYAEGRPRQWLDCAQPDTPHYGLKGVIRYPMYGGATLPNSYEMDVFATFSLSFKGQR